MKLKLKLSLYNSGISLYPGPHKMVREEVALFCSMLDKPPELQMVNCIFVDVAKLEEK